MKRTAKFFLGLVVVVVAIAILLLIPPVTARVSSWTGVAADKIKSVSVTVVGTGIGLIFIHFGVLALAALPIVGVLLIAIGVALVAYSLWPLFKGNTMKASAGGAQLNKMTA